MRLLISLCFLIFYGLGDQVLQAQNQQLEESRALAFAGQHAEAGQVLASLLQQFPDNLEARLLQAHNYSWSKRYDLAIPSFRSVLDEYPDLIDAWIGLGYAFTWSGSYSNALYPFQKALRLSPDHKEGLKGLGYAYLAGKIGSGAIPIFKKLSRQHPQEVEYLNALGKAYTLENKLRKAQKTFRQALDIDPTNTETKELLLRTRTEPSVLEFDAWSGWSKVADEKQFGLRSLQLSYQMNKRLTAYAKYDNSLSLDNIDFLQRNVNASSIWTGSLYNWNQRLASRMEYGLRFFSDQQTQQQLKAEQLIYFEGGGNLRLGAFTAFGGDLPAEWYAVLGGYIPLNEKIALEPSYYYARGGRTIAGDHRLVLAGKFRLPASIELSLGGFYGLTQVKSETGRSHIDGGYISVLLPFTKVVWWQTVLSYESGVFEKSFIAAFGLKLRLNRK